MFDRAKLVSEVRKMQYWDPNSQLDALEKQSETRVDEVD